MTVVVPSPNRLWGRDIALVGHCLAPCVSFTIRDLLLLPWTKCPPSRRRHFQMNFLEWKVLKKWKQISLRFVPKGLIHNNSALVQLIACSRFATSHYLNYDMELPLHFLVPWFTRRFSWCVGNYIHWIMIKAWYWNNVGVTGLLWENPSVTSIFPSQRISKAQIRCLL